jgi:hypothetical protein
MIGESSRKVSKGRGRTMIFLIIRFVMRPLIAIEIKISIPVFLYVLVNKEQREKTTHIPAAFPKKLKNIMRESSHGVLMVS